MVSVLILSFISGLLAATGAPHFVKGVSGEKHMTPFGKNGSAVENVVWGWLSMAIAAIVWHFAPMKSHPRAAFIGAAVGALFMGLILATAWGKKSAKA